MAEPLCYPAFERIAIPRFQTIVSNADGDNFPRLSAGEANWKKVVRTSRSVPIRKREPSIPERLAEVIDSALSEERRLHFQTASELRSALERA